MLFNPAEDQVDPNHREHWRGAVTQMRGAWLNFCHGEELWDAFDEGEGPGFVIRNGPKGELCGTLEELEGPETAKRRRASLELAE